MTKILVVEDDLELSRTLVRALELERYSVEAVSDGSDALHYLLSYQFDIVILDWDLPGLSGLEICRQYRSRQGRASVIMLTGKSHIDNKEQGLDTGADDYLTKPFQMRELMARIRAALRRPEAISFSSILRVGDLELDPISHSVTVANQPISVPRKEFAILECLMRHSGQVLTYETIFERVSKSDSAGSIQSIKVQVMRLRDRLGAAGNLIQNIYGVGYLCSADPAPGKE